MVRRKKEKETQIQFLCRLPNSYVKHFTRQEHFSSEKRGISSHLFIYKVHSRIVIHLFSRYIKQNLQWKSVSRKNWNYFGKRFSFIKCRILYSGYICFGIHIKGKNINFTKNVRRNVYSNDMTENKITLPKTIFPFQLKIKSCNGDSKVKSLNRTLTIIIIIYSVSQSTLLFSSSRYFLSNQTSSQRGVYSAYIWNQIYTKFRILVMCKCLFLFGENPFVLHHKRNTFYYMKPVKNTRKST